MHDAHKRREHGEHTRVNNLHFVIDFDGTIAIDDITDVLVKRFARSTPLQLEQDAAAGHITPREWLARYIGRINASPAEIDACAAEARPDEHFHEFTVRAQSLGATAEVVSDGMDRAILPLLNRLGVSLPVTCNRLCHEGGRNWRLEFPADHGGCEGGGGVCKCRAVHPRRRTVLIGDGLSDFCIAGRANFVLAKGALAAHCRANGYPHFAIAGFADALAWLNQQAGLPPAV